MHCRVRTAVFSVLLILLPASLPADFELGAWTSMGRPQGSEANFAYGATGMGGGVRTSWGLTGKSVWLPALFADLNYLSFGQENWYQPLNEASPGIGADVITDYYMLMLCPGFSVARRGGIVRPYAEIMGGMTYLSSGTRVDNSIRQGNPLDQTFDFSRWSYNIGLGGGLKLLLWSREMTGQASALKEALIDLKLDYITGRDSRYIRKNSVTRPLQDGPVAYHTALSKTDLLQIRLGMSFVF
jgi:hypothetical protein